MDAAASHLFHGLIPLRSSVSVSSLEKVELFAELSWLFSWKVYRCSRSERVCSERVVGCKFWGGRKMGLVVS